VLTLAPREEPETEEPNVEENARAEDEPADVADTAGAEEPAESVEEREDDEERAADEAVPLWQRFALRSEDQNVNARFGPPLADASDAPPTFEQDDAPLWKRFSAPPGDEPSPSPAAGPSAGPSAGEPSRAPERPTRPDSLEELERRVLGATTSGQRARFVKHLFGGDAGKYATVLHTLDAAGSWTEASQVIARDVFRPFRVNIYGEHAVAFTDAVEARFR